MSNNHLSFGNRLREIRNSKGLTQEQLAEDIGVSTNAIQQFERGDILPKYATLINIINVLDTDANLFFSRETIDYPIEARWIAELFIDMSSDERYAVGKFLEGVARVILDSGGINGGGSK